MRNSRRTLLSNSVLNALSNVTNVLVALALSPFIVHKLGLRAFGYWSIVLAVLSYVQIADAGLPGITARWVARALATDDRIALRQILSSSLAALAFMACIIGAATAGFYLLTPNSGLGDVPPGWRGATLWAGISLSILLLATGLSAIPRGAQRWGVDSAVVVIAQLSGAAATVALLETGGDLVSLGVATAIGNCVLLLGYAFVAWRAGALGLAGFRPRRDILSDLRRQGGSLQVVALVGATNAQADRLMLLPFASLSFIGAYALGSRVAVSLRNFPLSAFGPFMTRLASIDAQQPDARSKLYEQGVRATARYLAPALFALYFAGYPAVLAWLGAQYTVSAAGALVLGSGYAFNVLTGPGTAGGIAIGRAELDRDYNLLGLALNLVLSAALGLLFGAWGVIAATTCGLVLSSLWLLRRADSLFETQLFPNVLRDRQVTRNWAGTFIIGSGFVALTIVVAPANRVLNLFLACLAGAFLSLWLVLPLIHQRLKARGKAQ